MDVDLVFVSCLVRLFMSESVLLCVLVLVCVCVFMSVRVSVPMSFLL
jgi:hypothetical protein